MSGIDSLEYRLEKFIEGWRDRREPQDTTHAETLARAIIRQFGNELANQPYRQIGNEELAS